MEMVGTINDILTIYMFNSEFCGHYNDNVSLAVAPNEATVEYEIEPAPKIEEADEEKPDNEAAADNTKDKKTISQRSNLIIFVVDISGSMNITTEVPALQGIYTFFTSHIIVY